MKITINIKIYSSEVSQVWFCYSVQSLAFNTSVERRLSNNKDFKSKVLYFLQHNASF